MDNRKRPTMASKQRAEQQRGSWSFSVCSDWTLDEVLAESGNYFAHIAQFDKPDMGMRVGDIIDLVADDGSFDVRVRLIAKAPRLMKFRILYGLAAVEEEERVPLATDDVRFKLHHAGRGQWVVLDKASGDRMTDLLDKETAEQRLRELSARLAA